MKKSLSIILSLLAALVLVACSSSTSNTSSSSSTSQSTTTAVTYLTDAEIDAVQTLGDFKAAFRSLIDSYVADFDALIADAPSNIQTDLQPYREQVVQMMTQQEELIASQFASIGDDSTVIPDVSRETVISSLKSARDQLVAAMETAREQLETLQ